MNSIYLVHRPSRTTCKLSAHNFTSPSILPGTEVVRVSITSDHIFHIFSLRCADTIPSFFFFFSILHRPELHVLHSQVEFFFSWSFTQHYPYQLGQRSRSKNWRLIRGRGGRRRADRTGAVAPRLLTLLDR